MMDVLKKNPKPAAKPTADQSGLATATKAQPGFDDTQNQYGQQQRTNAVARNQAQRGSEFKKGAQQMLNK